MLKVPRVMLDQTLYDWESTVLCITIMVVPL